MNRRWFTGLTGVLHWSWAGSGGTDAWRVRPIPGAVYTPSPDNLRRKRPKDVDGDLVVASFNVLNYFTTLDTGQAACGPSGNAGCRGADSAAEFSRQREKTVSALLSLDADIVGVMEIENNGGVALSDLVTGMNALEGAAAWDYIDTGVIGTDAIVVGFLYRTAAVQPAGRFSVLTSAVDPRFDDGKNRPALAQTFATPAGERVTVAVNHLKSKGSDCNDVGDPNLGDGQGNCNLTRTRATLAMIDWLAGDPTSSGDPDILIIGDLNAYLREDPLRALEDAGYVNLLANALGDAAYSFVFAGQAGALDHALASPSLAPRVRGVAEWHINADEPRLYDYNLDFGRDAALFDGDTPFRASDHDPVLIGIDP